MHHVDNFFIGKKYSLDDIRFTFLTFIERVFRRIELDNDTLHFLDIDINSIIG